MPTLRRPDAQLFEQGRQAGLKNTAPSSVPAFTCMYERNRREDWMNGWRQGQLERQKSNPTTSRTP